MRFAIWMPILMRLASGLVFVIAIIVAGIANRSAMMVPLIAAVATLAHMNTPRMTINFGQKSEQSVLSRAFTVFLTRTILFGILFVVTVGISALFQETDLAREFATFDIFLLTVPFGLALLFTAISMLSPMGNPEQMMADIQKAFDDVSAGRGPATNDDAFTVEGEFEDKSDEPG